MAPLQAAGAVALHVEHSNDTGGQSGPLPCSEIWGTTQLLMSAGMQAPDLPVCSSQRSLFTKTIAMVQMSRRNPQPCRRGLA